MEIRISLNDQGEIYEAACSAYSAPDAKRLVEKFMPKPLPSYVAPAGDYGVPSRDLNNHSLSVVIDRERIIAAVREFAAAAGMTPLNHKIPLIKFLRTLTGAGLKEAKEFVETYVLPS